MSLTSSDDSYSPGYSPTSGFETPSTLQNTPNSTPGYENQTTLRASPNHGYETPNFEQNTPISSPDLRHENQNTVPQPSYEENIHPDKELFRNIFAKREANTELRENQQSYKSEQGNI